MDIVTIAGHRYLKHNWNAGTQIAFGEMTFRRYVELHPGVNYKNDQQLAVAVQAWMDSMQGRTGRNSAVQGIIYDVAFEPMDASPLMSELMSSDDVVLNATEMQEVVRHVVFFNASASASMSVLAQSPSDSSESNSGSNDGAGSAVSPKPTRTKKKTART